MKKYITYSLDEALFFMINGYKPEIEIINAVSSKFTFSEDKKLTKLIEEFWVGPCVVSLHQWIAMRQTIKSHFKRTITRARIVEIEKVERKPKVGDTYFYIVGQTICTALWGVKQLHVDRLKSNNVFETRAEAEEALRGIL